MSRYNIQFGASAEMRTDLVNYVKGDDNGDPIPPVNFPALSNMSEATRQFFRNVYDQDAIDRLFKQHEAQGRVYSLFSAYSNKPDDHQQVRSDLDAIAATYPMDFLMMGAWDYDTGAEVGGSGTEFWPIPAQYLNFMPDVMTDPGDPEADPPVPPTYAPATDPIDVNLLFGQAPRDFSSFYV